MIDYFKKPGKYPLNNLKNTEDQYFGNGWDVKRIGEKYFLSYISGELIGKSKEIEISQEDFEAAKKGEIDLDGFCIKYKVS